MQAFSHRALLVLTVFALLLLTVQRLPAPIQETQESPTPTPERLTKPKKAKREAKSENSEKNAKTKTSPSVSPMQQAVAPLGKKFAGIWKGVLDGTSWTIVVDTDETHAGASGGPWGTEQGGIHVNQNTISWTYYFNSWSLTALAGGKTAQVTVHYIGGTSTGTFERAN
jgi:hypothetical protein